MFLSITFAYDADFKFNGNFMHEKKKVLYINENDVCINKQNKKIKNKKNCLFSTVSKINKIFVKLCLSFL